MWSPSSTRGGSTVHASPFISCAFTRFDYLRLSYDSCTGLRQQVKSTLSYNQSRLRPSSLFPFFSVSLSLSLSPPPLFYLHYTKWRTTIYRIMQYHSSFQIRYLSSAGLDHCSLWGWSNASTSGNFVLRPLISRSFHLLPEAPKRIENKIK